MDVEETAIAGALKFVKQADLNLRGGVGLGWHDERARDGVELFAQFFFGNEIGIRFRR